MNSQRDFRVDDSTKTSSKSRQSMWVTEHAGGNECLTKCSESATNA